MRAQLVTKALCSVFGLLVVIADATPGYGEDRGPRFLDQPVNPRLPRERGPVYTADVNLVLVPVTVTDPQGRVVQGLDRDHFTILEDKSPQPIVSFSSEDTPCSIGLLLDTSGSMKDKISKARQATRRFFDTANAEDEAFLVTFADQPALRTDFTSDFSGIQAGLFLAEPRGSTALIDAVYLAVHRMRFARHSRKALLILSDGGDNHSRYSERELKSLTLETDVQIYAVGIHDHPRSHEELNGAFLLENLARLTGGLHFVIRDIKELEDVALKIGLALRNQYVIGFYPEDNPLAGKWRRIEVKVNPPGAFPRLRVYSRTGYFAPEQ